MNRLSLNEVHNELATAIQNKTPFSAIRLGDGEGRVIGFPEHVPLSQLSEIWKTWFGHSFFSDFHVKYIQNSLREACLAADLIGLPVATPDLSSDFGRVEPLLNLKGYITSTNKLCNAGFHLDLQHAGLYSSLFDGIDAICIIGSRDIQSNLASKFKVNNFHWIRLPPEMRFSTMSPEEKVYETLFRPHFTEVFFEIMHHNIPNAINSNPNQVFIVGGGVLGKLYCHQVKKLGGVAIDVGSMMDLWAGLRTRDNIEFDGLKEVTR